MKAIQSVKDGYSACAGKTSDGWYAGVLVREDKDWDFYNIAEDATYKERAKHSREWVDATKDIPRKVVLVTPEGDGISEETLAETSYLEGPVCPREETDTPVLAWIDRADGGWRVVLHSDGTTRPVLTSDGAIRCLRIAAAADGIILAVESDTGPRATQITVIDDEGVALHSTEGRVPILCSAGKGYVLATEQVTANKVTTSLEYIVDGSVVATTELSQGDYLFNGDMAWSDKDSMLVIAAESSPCFGYSNQIGKYREIHTWKWDLSSDPVSLGMLPVEKRAFHSFIAPENISPIRPKVLFDHIGPVVLFKQFRYLVRKTFGWDIFGCHLKDGMWREPVRVTSELTGSDTTFGFVPMDKEYIALFPAHDNEGGPSRSTDHRIDIGVFRPGDGLDRVEIPDDKVGEHEIPTSYKDISPEPPALDGGYKGRQLIWGDIHVHTIYSQCVSAVDGTPEENIRYVRDVLGCRVFAVAEHTHWITGPMSSWDFDRIEATVGTDNVLLYASEPGCNRMRHTNWYSRDRETFEKVTRMIISQGKEYHEILKQVREELPKDSLLVLRHFHGTAIDDEKIPEHFVPEFEVAMESMQGRCNAMVDPREGNGKFPNPFLDAGCRIGLVGGTDHFRVCPNHFCLTGFWVKEISADGVWEALKSRHTIAMSDSRVAMVTSCKGEPMGSELALNSGEGISVSLEASCARPIRRATLMRDGELLPWTEVNATTAKLDLSDPDPQPGYHWYVPTVEVETAYEEGHTGLCHASPYFVDVV